jgi:hypothetical protein
MSGYDNSVQVLSDYYLIGQVKSSHVRLGEVRLG